MMTGMMDQPRFADIRRKARIAVHIPVTITTVLETSDAEIVDLTEYGALISGPAPRKGSQFQIDYEGQTVFGFVIWEEGDRFGARFPFTLHDGPLFRRLEQARITHQASDGIATGNGWASPLIARPITGFGRRNLN